MVSSLHCVTCTIHPACSPEITVKLLSYSQLPVTSELLTFILMLAWLDLSVSKAIISYADERAEEQFHSSTSE